MIAQREIRKTAQRKTEAEMLKTILAYDYYIIKQAIIH